MRSLERIVALLPWCLSVCVSGPGVHSDHTVHFSANCWFELIWMCYEWFFNIWRNKIKRSKIFWPYWGRWGRPPRKKLGAKNFYICSVFRRLRDLMTNICWIKRDIDNQARALESTKGLLRCRKILWTLVHKRLKTGREFLPTRTILFCPSPSHTLYEALTWRPTATLNETALGSTAAQIWSPKRC